MLKIKDLIKNVTIEELAHSASHIVRFRGRYRWASLAEHLCLCYDLAKEIFPIENKDYNSQEHLRFIFSHDFCELVCMADIVKPVKPAVFIAYDEKIKNLSSFEHDLNKAIYIKIFGQPQTWAWSYKSIDNLALYLEIDYHNNDNLREKYKEEVEDALKKTELRFHGWDFKKSKEEFMKRYQEIAPKELINAG